jgi:hypothetical protein
MKRLALVVIILWASVAAAKARKWISGTVVSVETSRVAVAAWGDTNVIHYKIKTAHMTYVLDYAYNPAVKLPWPREHSRLRSPNLTVNGKTRISIDGRNAHVLDDDGRDIKLSIEEKIAPLPAKAPSK